MMQKEGSEYCYLHLIDHMNRCNRLIARPKREEAAGQVFLAEI